MGSATLRPNGVDSNPGGWTNVGGAASINAATADDLDTTYAQSTAFAPLPGLTLAMGTVAMPALAQVRTVTPRVRYSRETGTTPPINFYVDDASRAGHNNNKDYPAVNSTKYTVAGAPLTTKWNGQPWLQADIDAILFVLNNFANNTFRVYEAYIDVVYNEAPVGTATGPTGSISTTTRPPVVWTYSDPETDLQERVRAKIFTAAQYGAGGFDPETSTPYWDSGEVFTAALTQAVTVDLPNDTYRAYVKVADVGSGGRYGAWTFSGFVMAVVPPAVPTVVATDDPANGRVSLLLQGRDNMLTANQASLETDLTGWVNNGNAFLARSVADAADGVASLQLTAAGAGDMSAVTSPSTGIPCDPSTVYTAVARFKAATVARNVRVILNWRTAADASISSTIGAAFPDVTTGYSLAWVTGASPANAAFVRVLVQADAVGAAEVHRVDTISLVPGAVNLLTEDQASSEAALAYTAVAGTVARTVPGDYGGLLPKQGGSMLAITGTATPQNSYGRQTTPTPAIPATNYTIVASFRTVAPYGVPRSVRLNARWLDAASAQISEPASGQVFDSDTGWTQVVWQVTSPALTASVQVEPQIMGQSNGEVHFVEALAVIPGWFTDYVPPLAWTPGGFTPSQRIYVERSADAGVTWAAVKRLVPTAAQSVDADGGANVYDQTQNGTFYDYEAPPRTALLYRASASATVAALVLASGKSATSSVQHVPVSGWLKDPLYPALDRAFRFIGEMHLRPREPQGEFDGIGLTQPVTATEGWKGYEGSLDVQLDSKADHDAFLALASTGRVLLLVDPALPLQWYVKLASGIDLGRLRAADPSATYPVRHLHRVTVPFRTAAAPA